MSQIQDHVLGVQNVTPGVKSTYASNRLSSVLVHNIDDFLFASRRVEVPRREMQVAAEISGVGVFDGGHTFNGRWSGCIAGVVRSLPDAALGVVLDVAWALKFSGVWGSRVAACFVGC